MKKVSTYRVGIIGAGFISRGLAMALEESPHFMVSAVLTRRDPETLGDMPVSREIITNSIDHLVSVSDIVVECTGDVIHGTVMIEHVLSAGLPVVTMNSELQLVSGTMLARQGTLIEAEGDQPGSLAALDMEVREMGFTPLVYGNIKRFLNLTPTKDEMEYWAKRQGISLTQVTSFTDGTKVQIEQALVANGLGATITRRNLSGPSCAAVEDGAHRLGEMAEALGQPISDYILSPTAPAGVFIVGKHSGKQKAYLEYLKLGKGPHYVITRPYHLCHLEIPKTLLKILSGDLSYSFNNGQHPTVQVLAIPKRDIKAGEFLGRGLGSFDVRGEAAKIKDYPQGVPIGLLQEATFVRPVSAGQVVKFDDVVLPKTRALEMWQQTVAEISGQSKIESSKKKQKINTHKPKLKTVTIGIPAHNEEANIAQVLKSIINQRSGTYLLEKIIVLCDGCSDETELRARDFARHYPIIEVTGGRKRLGKAVRLNELKQANTSDIVINFDADVVLRDYTVIEKLVGGFSEDGVVAVSGNNRPVEVQGLVAKTIRAGDQLWYRVRKDYHRGNNLYNSAGCAMALSKDFADSWRFPVGLVADQQFVYFKVMADKKKFRFVEDAVVWYQTPNSISALSLQAGRSLNEKDQTMQYFSDDLLPEYDIPVSYKVKAIVRSLVAQPLYTSLTLMLQVWLRLKPVHQGVLYQNGLWEMVDSTKKITF